MSTLKQARIIHLTDLHFGAGHRFQSPLAADGSKVPSRGYPTLAQSILKDLGGTDFQGAPWSDNGTNPLLVAVSGDLTQRGSRSELDQAEHCLFALSSASVLGSQVSASEITVVPGNHDVLFDRDDPVERWAGYCGFEKRLRGNIVDPEHAYELSRIVHREDDGLIVAEINSCFDVRAGSPDAYRGLVDDGVVSNLRKQLEAIPREARDRAIKIAVLHHHPVVLPTLVEAGRGYDAVVNSALLLSLLRDEGFHLLLHGHKHNPHTFSYDTQCAWKSEPIHPFLVVAGGSAGTSDLTTEPGATNTYNVIVIKWNPSARHGRVQVVTRGLVRHDDRGQLLPAPDWYWSTLKVDDRLLSVGDASGVGRLHTSRAFGAEAHDDSFERSRKAVYTGLRQNMPVTSIVPSLDPSQDYDVQVSMIPHYAPTRDVPRVVEWSAGPKFKTVAVCDRGKDPAFRAQFKYWGAMLIQARLFFDDGSTAEHSIYVPKPGY